MKRSELMEVILEADASIRNVVENWMAGDLAEAVRDLERFRKESVVPAIKWWESGQ